MCKVCGSLKQAELNAEICIHCLGLENLDTPPVLVFPKLSVCLDCGASMFAIPEKELLLIRKRVRPEAGFTKGALAD
jgi:hypothetical protein